MASGGEIGRLNTVGGAEVGICTIFCGIYRHKEVNLHTTIKAHKT